MHKKIVAIIIILVLVVITVIRLKNNKETTQKRVYQYDKETPISVQVDTLKLREVDAEYSYTGTFEPYKEAKISAEIQGKVNTLLVDLGSMVKAEQALIQLDNSLLQLQLQSTEVQIEGLLADVKRYTVLATADAIQRVQLEKSELALKGAQIQKATILEQINKTTIKAPFNGIITAKITEAGSFAAPGVPLLQITDISQLRFIINIPEQEIGQFRLEQATLVTIDAFSDIVLSGVVSVIGSKANNGNSYPVHILIENTPDLAVKAGMSGHVLIAKDDNLKQIMIPSSAIAGTTLKPRVYKVKTGKAILSDITIKSRMGNYILVEKGLSEGDVIVTNGFINLYDGANILLK